jgi:hypothetical protein
MSTFKNVVAALALSSMLMGAAFAGTSAGARGVRHEKSATKTARVEKAKAQKPARSEKARSEKSKKKEKPASNPMAPKRG